MLRRLFIAASAAAMCTAVAPAWAQAFPPQPIRPIVPFTPGGGTDSAARLVADKIQQTHEDWALVIDKRPGAGGAGGHAADGGGGARRRADPVARRDCDSAKSRAGIALTSHLQCGRVGDTVGLWSGQRA